MIPNKVLDICLYACLETKACRGLVVGCPQREREYWSRRGELAAEQLLAGAVEQSRGWEGRRGKKGWWGPSTTCFSSLQVNINKNRFWKRERNFCSKIGAFWDQKFPQQSFKTSTKQLHTCLNQCSNVDQVLLWLFLPQDSSPPPPLSLKIFSIISM